MLRIDDGPWDAVSGDLQALIDREFSPLAYALDPRTLERADRLAEMTARSMGGSDILDLDPCDAVILAEFVAGWLASAHPVIRCAHIGPARLVQAVHLEAAIEALGAPTLVQMKEDGQAELGWLAITTVPAPVKRFEWRLRVVVDCLPRDVRAMLADVASGWLIG